MKKIILTRGLPASGKSTWARQQVVETPGVYKRVNKDDLRLMLDCGKWSKDNEKFITLVRDAIIIAALGEGKHVIVDDTNFAPKHEQRMFDIARLHGAVVEIKTFDTPLEECIRRDLLRPASVGEAVIRKMYDQYLAPQGSALEQNSGLPKAIIVDIDGTLCKMNGRSPFEWDKVDTDLANTSVVNLVNDLSKNKTIIFLSGRDGCCALKTINWIHENTEVKLGTGPTSHKLFMRTPNDNRKDSIIKRELFDQQVRGKYFVEFVLDDRDQVVELWRKEIGLPCFQVDYGNF